MIHALRAAEEVWSWCGCKRRIAGGWENYVIVREDLLYTHLAQHRHQ